jgi:xylonate dehydratase
MPAGEFLGEDFYRAGSVPAVMGERLRAGKLDPEPLTVSGLSIADAVRDEIAADRRVIRPYDEPLAKDVGFLMLSSNLFDSAVKTSVITPEFRRDYLSDPADPDAFVVLVDETQWQEIYRRLVGSLSEGPACSSD